MTSPVRRHAPFRRALGTGAAALVAGLLLAGCGPAAPAAAPGATTAGAPSPKATPPAPSATPAPTPSASPEDTAATDEQLLLVTQADRDTIALVDPRERTGSADSPTDSPAVLDEITVGAAPWDVAVHAETGRAFVSTAEGVAVVDLATRERTDLVGYEHGPARVAYGEYRPGGLGLAVSPDGATVYVAVSTGEEAFLEQIDVADGDVVRSVPVGRRPFDVLVGDDGREVYTIDHDGFTVTVVDAGTFDAHAIEVAPFGTEGGLASFEKPHYAVLDADGNLLLPYQGRALARVDPATGEVTTTGLDADTHQHGVARADDGTLVVAGNGPFGNADSGASIEVVSPAGDSTVLPTDRRHETVAVWQHDGAAFGVLAGGYTQDGAWDGLTVLPLAAALDGTDESYEIRVPGRPQAVVPVTLPEPETSSVEGNP
ncbi:YncE family protein [Promicromonospora sukumoe]|uniref:YncE family protein n=1 Tax=Promicromonospora sukumoe TaxID=88382 RepID=UPI000361BD76|nr:YncE family protein [Promicromonospora sukumoe]